MSHTILSQVTHDIAAARKIWLPWRVLLVWAVISLAVIMLCDHFGRAQMAMPLLMCIAVFAFLIRLKRDLWRQATFWSVMAALIVVHAVLLWWLPWTSKWVPAAVTAGFASIDFCLMLLILAVIEVTIAGRSPPDLTSR